MLCALSLFISMQKTRQFPATFRRLWPKNFHADTLTASLCVNYDVLNRFKACLNVKSLKLNLNV